MKRHVRGLIAGVKSAKSHRADFSDVGNEMTQQILNAVAQRRRRRRTAGAGAFHIEIDDAVLEAAERDVAAVIGDRGTNPGLDQFLDGGNRRGVHLVKKLLAVLDLGAAADQERRARHEVLHDGAQDHWLELMPFARALGHGDEIGAEEYPAYSADTEQPLGERRLFGLRGMRRSRVPLSRTGRPGTNFIVDGFGVASV